MDDSKREIQTSKPIPWTTTEILKATGGSLLCGDLQHVFSGISIDSRTIASGDLFVAIQGQVHEGHKFIPGIIDKGIQGIIVNESKTGELPVPDWRRKGIVSIAVKDTTKALGDLAAFNRRRSNASVIAITGSNGKTTTREMTAALLSRRFNTLSTRGNLNNHIGLPLTLLRLNPQHQWAVLELGMNHPGEIGLLTQICSPEIGVITNISSAHLEGLGSIDGVMRAKGELLEKIKPGGTAVLNADDPKVSALASRTNLDTIFFGLSQKASVRALSIKATGTENHFRLALPTENLPIILGIPGEFMISNALASAAVGFKLGLTGTEIKGALENFKPVNGRMNILKTRKGVNIIDDSYNANPASMHAAITTMKALKGKSRSIVVAGDMLELGNQAESLHKMIGTFAAKSNIARLYITGDFAGHVKAGALEQNMKVQDIFTGTKEEILIDIKARLLPGDWVLIKGSRAMKMEKIVHGLIDWGNI